MQRQEREKRNKDLYKNKGKRKRKTQALRVGFDGMGWGMGLGRSIFETHVKLALSSTSTTIEHIRNDSFYYLAHNRYRMSKLLI